MAPETGSQSTLKELPQAHLLQFQHQLLPQHTRLWDATRTTLLDNDLYTRPAIMMMLSQLLDAKSFAERTHTLVWNMEENATGKAEQKH